MTKFWEGWLMQTSLQTFAQTSPVADAAVQVNRVRGAQRDAAKHLAPGTAGAGVDVDVHRFR